MSVIKKINEIMKEVTILKKDGKIAFGSTKYSFIQDDEVVTTLREKMVEKGLVMYPSEAYTNVHGENGKYLSVTQQTFTIVDTEDDSKIEVATVGQGYDSADKGSGKSMTNARKYALLQTFMLTGDDPDKTASDSYHTPTTSAPPTDQDPATVVITFGMKHKGKTIGDVFVEDRGYIEWLANKPGDIQWAAKAILERQ